MKNINKLLMIITIILTVFFVLGELDRGIIVFLKDLSIILTVTMPYIYKKIFKKNLDEGFIFVWIIFIFLSHYIGVALEYYNTWQGFDKFTHMISGVLTGYVALEILNYKKSKDLGLNALFIISFSWLCAGLWETFEFICNYLFGGDAQKVAETGVSDTMWDMIVAFIGSILFSIWYIIRKKQKDSQ